MGTKVYHPRARVMLEVLLEGREDTLTLDVEPREIEVTRNPPREADTCRVVLEYRHLPLDPRSVRGILLGGFLGDVADVGDDLGTGTETRSFIGPADSPATELSEDGETVTVEARDYTALFLDQPWATTIDLRGKTLGQVVRKVVAAVPGAAGLTVAFDGDSESLRTADLVGRSRWTPQERDDAWTVLTELCGLLGYLPVVELDTLRVTTIEALGSREAFLLYGEDVHRLTYRRQAREVTTGQIKVVCWNGNQRQALVAVYPATPAQTRVAIGPAGVETADGRVIEHHVHGTYTQQDLDILAERLYAEVVRSQLDGEFETREMEDLDEATDLTRLAAGDVLHLALGKDDPSVISGMSHGEAVAYLSAGPRGLDEQVAEAVVSAWEHAEATASTFLVSQATHRWRADEGYTLAVEFQSFVGASDA